MSPEAMPTPHEIATSLSLIRAAHGTLSLIPVRVQAFCAPTTAPGRHVLMQLWSPARKSFFEAIIALNGRTLVSFRPLPQAPLTADEQMAVGLVTSSPRFQQLTSQRRMNANELVMVPCASTSAPTSVRGLFFNKSDLMLSAPLVPVDGLFPVVDVKTKAIQFLDRFDQQPFPEPAPTEAPAPSVPLRADAKTVAEHAKHALAIVHKQTLSQSEADQVMTETIQYWKVCVCIHQT